jgi:tRNA (cmo5U34)-methyltransferase
MSDNKRNFDKEAAQWDENPVRVKLATDVCIAIRKTVPVNNSMRVLDFGCGTGLLTLGIAPFAGSVTGVDNSKGMLAVLREKIARQDLRNIDTLFLDLDRGDSLTGNYDMIMSSMTLHHVERIPALLKQFHKILAPDGYLCIADLDPDKGLFHPDNKGVFHLGFERTDLYQAFMEAGFDRISDTTAAEVSKPISSEEMKRFSVFLMTGRKT